MYLLYISIFSLLIVSIRSDECSLIAICNCIAKNETSTSTDYKTEINGLNADSIVHPDICNGTHNSNSSVQTSSPQSSNETTPLKYALTCQYVNFKNNSNEIPSIKPINQTQVVLKLNYPCDAPKPAEHHYSTGTVLVIIFFTLVFAYLGMGVAVNYFLIGARGVELIPHLSFWKDFPSLVQDGVRFLQNGCKARPSELNSTSPDSYDAI